MNLFSVLDVVPIPEGDTITTALHNTRDLAQHAERLGYHRFWLAEHHNMAAIASAATSVIIGFVAENTSTIRVGAGGVMLPNHAPLIVAEQFGTLESLYPGRIDLGLGRAAGTDPSTVMALRRPRGASDDFGHDVQELQRWFEPVHAHQTVEAVPATGMNVPIWILGSSLYGAQLAARLGLPFGFASHFAPDALMAALQLYRETFKPSEQCAEPQAMAAVNVIIAETDEEAKRHFTSVQRLFTNLSRGLRARIQAPIDDIGAYWSTAEQAQVSHMLRYSFVGTKDVVRKGLRAFLKTTEVDELLVGCFIHDHAARLHSYERLAELRDEFAD